MKKLFVLLLGLIMIFSLAIGGRVITKAEDAAEHDPIILTFACYLNETEPDVIEFLQPWLDNITADCAEKGYDVEFECYWGASLFKQPESYKGVVDGTADIAFFINGMTSNFPLDALLGFPWNGVEIENPCAVYEDMIAQFPELQDEYFETHLLLSLMTQGQKLNSTKEFHNLAESAGIKWSAAGSITNSVFDKWGWTGVQLAPPEVYSGLERNLVDGIGSTAKTCYANAWYEVTSYRYTNLAIVNQSISCIMNQDVWAALPAEVQEVFDYYSSGGGYDIGAVYSKTIADMEVEYEEKLAEEGMNYVTIEDDALAEFCDLVDEARNEWAAEQDSAGNPGTEMLEYLRELFDKYNSAE